MNGEIRFSQKLRNSWAVSNLNNVENLKKRLWVFDFDGTLSPLVSNRNEAKLHPLCEELLKDLVATPVQFVAVLSSRLLDDLIPLVGVPELWLGGGSGVEWMSPDGSRLSFAGTLSALHVRSASRSGVITLGMV